MNPVKNDLLLRALRREETARPPVWMMRQAGRYLPEYIALRERYDFFTRVQTPDLAATITLQPVERLEVDAAILFSDILVIPQAMGVEVLMEEGRGPLLTTTMRSGKDVDALVTDAIEERLDYVFRAIALTQERLDHRVPLIGFAGAPFTILCYMVEGKGSKTWDKARQFCYTEPALAARLLDKITDATIAYLQLQVKAGADVVQVFDSWSGCLGPEEFGAFALPYLARITQALKAHAPVILFPKGSWYALEELSNCGASALGLDWCIAPGMARKLTGDRVALQGNFDPAKLLLPPAEIGRAVTKMIDAFGTRGYIANLGHGIMPHVPVDHAMAFVNAVKNYRSQS